MVENVTCNPSTLLNLSNFCLSHPNASHCFHSDYSAWIEAEIISALVNSFIGFAGNLLTILAIPYAAKNKK